MSTDPLSAFAEASTKAIVGGILAGQFLEKIRDTARACVVYNHKLFLAAEAYHQLPTEYQEAPGPHFAEFIASATDPAEIARSLVALGLLEKDDPIFGAVGISL